MFIDGFCGLQFFVFRSREYEVDCVPRNQIGIEWKGWMYVNRVSDMIQFANTKILNAKIQTTMLLIEMVPPAIVFVFLHEI